MTSQETVDLIDYAVSVHGSPQCLAALAKLREEFARQNDRDLDHWFSCAENYPKKVKA